MYIYVCKYKYIMLHINDQNVKRNKYINYWLRSVGVMLTYYLIKIPILYKFKIFLWYFIL